MRIGSAEILTVLTCLWLLIRGNGRKFGREGKEKGDDEGSKYRKKERVGDLEQGRW